jgi:BirA family transcriptional regulator, biotin operon repressor / biotin---[acetyl-CoA-carboxylase] ligase
MKERILEYLRNSKKYVSGEDISRELNISRTAVWKYINKLKEEGYSIESSSKKGYRLVESPDRLSYEEISPLLDTNYIGRNVLYFDSVASTNDIVREYAQRGEPEGLIAVAEEQTKGRGRMGRRWSTPKGVAIAMSMLLRPNLSPQFVPTITSVIAVSVVEALTSVTGFDIKIKWPNDIVLDGKKLCGILTEMSAEIDAVNHVIIGMGMNINQDDFEDDIKDVAVSLKSYSGKSFERKLILAEILNRFEENYEIFKFHGVSPFIDKIKRFSALLNNRVIISNINEKFEGEAIDIDMDGCLIVRLDNGDVRRVISGDVSVRGLYGYTP